METIAYRPGKALSESEGFTVIESYLSSGLSAKAFAKRLGMGEKTFYKWRHRYLNRQCLKENQGPALTENGSLVPIRVAPAAPTEPVGSGPPVVYLSSTQISQPCLV